MVRSRTLKTLLDTKAMSRTAAAIRALDTEAMRAAANATNQARLDTKAMSRTAAAIRALDTEAMRAAANATNQARLDTKAMSRTAAAIRALDTEAMRAAANATNQARLDTKAMSRTAAAIRALDTEAMRAAANATNQARLDTKAMSRTAAAIRALDTEAMRAAANATNQAWATLDDCIRAKIWPTSSMDVTLTGLPAPSVRVHQDRVNEASRDENEGVDLPTLQSHGASAHPAWWATLAVSAALVEGAPELVLAILGELVVALELLNLVQGLPPAIRGLFILMGFVSFTWTLVQLFDRQ